MNRKVRTRGIIDPLRNYDRRPVKRHRTEVEDGNIRPQEECEGELFQKQAQKQKSNGKRQSKIVNADTNSARALSSEFSSPLSCPATPVIPFAASLFNSEMIGTASNNYSNNYNDDDSNNAKNNNKNNSKVLIPDEDNVDFEFNELALKKRKMTLPKQPMLSKNSSSYLLNIPFAEDFEIDKILREQESSEDLIINHGVEKFKQIIDLLDPAYFLPTPEDQNENEMDLNYSDTSNSALFLQSASFIRENNFANISPIFPAQNVELRIPIASNPDTESEKIPSMSQYFENSFDFESFEHEDHTEDDDSSIQGIENGVGGVATNNVSTDKTKDGLSTKEGVQSHPQSPQPQPYRYQLKSSFSYDRPHPHPQSTYTPYQPPNALDTHNQKKRCLLCGGQRHAFFASCVRGSLDSIHVIYEMYDDLLRCSQCDQLQRDLWTGLCKAIGCLHVNNEFVAGGSEAANLRVFRLMHLDRVLTRAEKEMDEIGMEYPKKRVRVK